MTIRFAAATTGHNAARHAPACQKHARALIANAMERVSNDDGPALADRNAARTEADRVLHAALRHFGEHGLGAARVAGAQAEAALSANNQSSYDWWLAITRTLDRRLAADVERRALETA